MTIENFSLLSKEELEKFAIDLINKINAGNLFGQKEADISDFKISKAWSGLDLDTDDMDGSLWIGYEATLWAEVPADWQTSTTYYGWDDYDEEIDGDSIERHNEREIIEEIVLGLPTIEIDSYSVKVTDVDYDWEETIEYDRQQTFDSERVHKMEYSYHADGPIEVPTDTYVSSMGGVATCKYNIYGWIAVEPK